jgi:hypothetical protein
MVQETLSRKYPTQKKPGWQVTQVIEHLPGKRKTLCSNPSTTKKKSSKSNLNVTSTEPDLTVLYVLPMEVVLPRKLIYMKIEYSLFNLLKEKITIEHFGHE